MILNRYKGLIIVSWVEARNPTFQMGLNPTYLKTRLFVQALTNSKNSEKNRKSGYWGIEL
jgi:hypothetical protein